MTLSPFPLCFMHLGKVGGHAISRELFNRFDRKRVLNVSPWEMDEIPDEELVNYDLINGHWTGWQVEKLPPKRFLFSMLREPVSRVLSAYWFCRSWTSTIDSTNDVVMEKARTLSLEEWVHCDHEQIVRIVENYQTRHFGGDWRHPVPADDALFAKAVERLEAFDLIGVYEQYDNALQILCSKFGWLPWPSERRLNVSVPVEKRPELPRSVRTVLEDRNAYDMELYDRARVAFERTVRNELRRMVAMARTLAREDAAEEGGARPAAPEQKGRKLPERLWLAFNQAIVGEGWQPRVEDGGPAYSWIGPSCQASLELAVRTDSDLQVRATLVGWIDDETADSIELAVAGETCRRIGFSRFAERSADDRRPHITAVWLVPADAARRSGAGLELVFRTARAAIIDYPGPNGLEPLAASVAISDVVVEPAHSTLRASDDVDRALWIIDKTYSRQTREDRERFDAAAELLGRYLEERPDNPRGLFGMGWVDMALERFGMATDRLLAAHAHFPTEFHRIAPLLAQRFAAVLTECAMRVLWSAGPQFSIIVQAERLARAATERNPDDPNAWYWLGETMCYQGRNIEALPFFQRAAKENAADHGRRIHPTRLGALHTRLGEGYVYTDKLENAAQEFETAQRTSPLEGIYERVYEDVKATLKSGNARRLLRYPIKISQFQDLDTVIRKHLYLDSDFPRVLRMDSRVTTLGSCFAANIAIRLGKLGIEAQNLGGGERINSTYANRALLEWAIDDISDVFSPDVFSNLENRYKKNPADIRHMIANTDIVIFTLGVAPCFFSKEDGRFTLSEPEANTFHMLNHADFRTTTVEENIQNIERICDIIWDMKHTINIVFSVSPVPMKASFEYSSAIVADCISKSTLRVAVDQVIKRRDRKPIHYWPAFEAVRWAGVYRSGSFGAEDGTTHHVSEDTVRAITSGFVHAFGDDAVREKLEGM
nr:GSCFA domain-containing protein [Azospirillum sp. 412522]